MLTSSSVKIEDIDKFIRLTSEHIKEEDRVIPIFEELKNANRKNENRKNTNHIKSFLNS